MSAIAAQNVRSVRIEVEPVEVELEDDGSGILWTSLQTAFPGCSGMYYRQPGDSCKRSVRFDGKKFVAPGGSWQGRDYFVTLSQRCHAAQGNNSSRISSYTEATKQFERNVQAVQKMMAASGMKIDISSLTKRRHHRETGSSTDSSTNPDDPLHAINERSKMLRNLNDRDLSPLEQQFLDLCRISTAKDQIIDSNRQEITQLNEQILNLRNVIKENESRHVEDTAKIRGQEEELEILRNLGNQFGESKDSVERLSRKSIDLEENVTNLQLKLINSEEKNESIKAQLETSNNRIKEMDESIKILSTTRDLLTKELNQLRPFADAAGVEDFDNIRTYLDTLDENRRLREDNDKLRHDSDSTREAFDQLQNIQTPIYEENAKLRKKAEDLERRVEHFDEEIKCLNENWAKELRDKQLDWAAIKEEAEQEVSSLREQLAHLQTILESATREAAENARRVSELEQERHEIRRMSDAAHVKSQEELRYQNRVLREELSEAESRVAELNILVSTLAIEANNSRRDINDIL